MALATRCPNCSALFRVSADQLKIRGGMVRCGSCRHVFNAVGCLDYLEGHRPAAEVPAETARPRGKSERAEKTEPAAPAPAPQSAPARPAPLRAAAVRETDVPARETAPVVERGSPAPSASGAADLRPGTAPAEEPQSQAPSTGGPAPTLYRLLTDTEASARDEIGANGEQAQGDQAQVPAAGSDAAEPTFLRPRGNGSAGRVALALACLLLAPVLVIELLLFFRASIVAAYPQARPALAALCQPLSCTASWPMHPDLLAVVSSELQAVPGTDALELIAVVRSRANFPMALPALELTLTDTLNRPVARRIFLPADYRPARSGADPGDGDALAAGADVSIRLLFSLPGINAAGFVAYPFYP